MTVTAASAYRIVATIDLPGARKHWAAGKQTLQHRRQYNQHHLRQARYLIENALDDDCSSAYETRAAAEIAAAAVNVPPGITGRRRAVARLTAVHLLERHLGRLLAVNARTVEQLTREPNCNGCRSVLLLSSSVATMARP